jgi:hypothetical protein
LRATSKSYPPPRRKRNNSSTATHSPTGHSASPSPIAIRRAPTAVKAQPPDLLLQVTLAGHRPECRHDLDKFDLSTNVPQ